MPHIMYEPEVLGNSFSTAQREVSLEPAQNASCQQRQTSSIGQRSGKRFYRESVLSE
jgi:hypothetical protein